jgi:hypothetical protein
MMKFRKERISKKKDQFGKKEEPEMDLGLTKFLNEDISFIEDRPDFNSKMKIDPNFSKLDPFAPPDFGRSALGKTVDISKHKET